jgi:hypothetical protein
MATTTHYLSGPCKWAKVYKPDEKYNKHSIDIGFTKDGLANYTKLGLKNKPKEADGLYWVTFRRDPEGKVWINGKQEPAGKPGVFNPDGSPCTEIIGNGSEVTIVVSTYDYDNKFGKGKGSRLEKVRVDKLVKYEKEEARSNDPDIPF